MGYRQNTCADEKLHARCATTARSRSAFAPDCLQGHHVEEFSFVSIHKSCLYLVRRFLFFTIALAAPVSLCSGAMAQTAPQLLPYSVKVVAGGGTAGGSGWTTGKACPVSGYTSTDNYGDGCLATEIALSGPRTAVADANGNIFFTDYSNGLIRRVDALSGIVTAVAGGVAYTASPGNGAACATGSSLTATDAKGDGCLGTQVFVGAPIGLAFSPSGDLYFSEIGSSASGATFGADVRKIAATNGTITGTGVISMVDGALSTYSKSGFTVNNYGATPACSDQNLTNCVVAATSSYLGDPYGLAFDKNGDLYIAEEYKQAVLVVNTSSATNKLFAGTANEVDIPAGTVAKIVGAYTPSGGSTTSACPTGNVSPYGCSYPSAGQAGYPYTIGASANSVMIDNPYAVAVDASGSVYFSDYYLYNVPQVPGSGSSAGGIYLYAGVNASPYVKGTYTAPVTTRGIAGSSSTPFPIGYPHGVAADSNNNVYIADATNGVVWRVDGAGDVPGQMAQPMYPVAGGAASVCGASIVPGVTAIDTYGDGCAATSAKFGTGSTGGIFGLSVDAYSDLFVGDTVTNMVREVASGTQFGPIGANQPTQRVAIHFAAGDLPATTSPYVLTGNVANFSLGSATCTTNSDTTTDCVLPVTATPTALGPFTNTLQVTSKLGATASFPLSGTYVATPLTRTVVSASQAANCSNTTAYNTTTPVTLTATIFSSGANPPTGTVTFYASYNSGAATQIGTAQPVSNNIATLTYTFATTGSYAITAVYSGDSYYLTSTSSADTITSAAPSLSPTAVSNQQSTVHAGQTALYSFNLQQNVFTGTISFSCSGLPANSSCIFSPNSISASGCQTSNTVAMSILTQQQPAPMAASFGAGHGLWQLLSLLSGIGLALLIGLRRRSGSGLDRVWLMLALLLTGLGASSCNGAATKVAATPAGSYTVTVTASGSTGTASTFTVPLTVQ